ncbi:hypothetical protein D5S17_20100 [Pseudonocardiaceae bacterium YIM PH 21723]|nr:hypothetical protein D5S17_20100 [Pseudonocardiaceae bacterium YIM PH 21723]
MRSIIKAGLVAGGALAAVTVSGGSALADAPTPQPGIDAVERLSHDLNNPQRLVGHLTEGSLGSFQGFQRTAEMVGHGDPLGASKYGLGLFGQE